MLQFLGDAGGLDAIEMGDAGLFPKILPSKALYFVGLSLL